MKSLKKNIYINLFVTIIIGVLGFVVNKVFSNTMGGETLGLMRLFTQMVAYLNLADLGIAVSSSYALYKPLENNDIKRVSIIVSTIDYFYKRIALIILIVGLLGNIFLSKLINTNIYGNYIYIYWMLFVINTSLSYIFAKYSVLFTANQEYAFVRKVQGSSRILVNILQLVILVLTRSFLFYIIIMIGQNLYNYYFFYRHFKNKYKKIEKVKAREKEIIKDMKNLFWHSIAGLVVYNTDFILLSKFTSLETVAIYSTYLIVYQMILTTIGILTPVLTPRIGKFIAQHNKLEIYKYWEKLHLLYMIVGTIITITSYYMLNSFIRLWMGLEYVMPILTISLLLVNLFFQMTRCMMEVFKTNSGFYDDIYNPILESIINLVISLVLVQKIGLNGVIIGTISSNIVIVYILKPVMVFIRCFDKKVLDYIFIYTKYMLLVGTTIVISKRAMEYFNLITTIDSWFNWIISAIKTTGVIGVITGIVFLLDGIFRIEVIKVLRKLKNII